MTLPATVSPETAATLLLCGRFGPAREGVNVLSPSKFNDLSHWLDSHKLSFADLLKPDVKAILRAYQTDPEAVGYLYQLLHRTDELAAALSHWGELGIWVVSRNDPDYPLRLRQRLKLAAFPLLFGAGPRGLLDEGGVCVVGSRDSSRQGLEFAKRLGARCGEERMTVVSSDMRGVDREAVTAALEAGGRVICVLSDCLEKALAGRRYRTALDDGKLTTVTPFSPETRFKVANAIRANKYQYALSDVAVVVETRQTGGVWLGADENRNEGWVPAFVHVGDTMAAGNMALLHLGLKPITIQDVEKTESLRDFFLRQGLQAGKQKRPAHGVGASPRRTPADLYSIFLAELRILGAGRMLAIDEIASMFAIEPAQAKVWIARAVEDGAATQLESSGVYSVD